MPLLDVRGTGVAKKVVQLASPLQESNTIQLKYLRFPPLPLVTFWYNAILDLSDLSAPEHLHIMPQSSLAGLAHYLTQLVNAGGNRLFRAFYNESANKFEIDNLQSALVFFSIPFADYMNFPTDFPPNAHWEIGISEKVIDAYSHYRVSVKNVKGCHDGRDYDEIIGRVYRDGRIETHKHNFRNTTRQLDIEVRAARLDNETEAYESETEWAVGFEIL